MYILYKRGDFFMKRKTKALIFNIALPLIVGGVSAYISRDGMESFKALAQPPLSPPLPKSPHCRQVPPKTAERHSGACSRCSGRR